MSNPQIYQGTLNRLLTSVVFSDNIALSVTSPFLGKGGITLSFEGEASQLHGTLTGGVPSPEPYQFANVSMHLVRSQGLATAYKLQFETNTNLGRANVISDTLALLPYQLNSCVLQSVENLAFDGNQVEFVVKFRGIYMLNSAAFFGS